jgi:hypothetical protein
MHTNVESCILMSLTVVLISIALVFLLVETLVIDLSSKTLFKRGDSKTAKQLYL